MSTVAISGHGMSGYVFFMQITSILILFGPLADKKALRAYTSFAQPRVGSRSSLLVLYLQQGPYIM